MSNDDGYARIRSWALNYFSYDKYVEEFYNYWYWDRIGQSAQLCLVH